MQAGDIFTLGGFFTKAMFLRSQSGAEIERRLGYRTGRLSDGWRLLFLTEMPGASDFEYRGYTQMSGGVPLGHLLNPPDKRNSEQRLKDDGFDLGKLKLATISGVFTLEGPARLAKVIPVRGEYGEADYPPGIGYPQWTLTKRLNFKVAAVLGPGETYLGDYR